MKTFFNFSGLSGELKRLARENIAQGRPLSIMDDAVFKAMLASNNDDAREALRNLLSACIKRDISIVQIANNDLVPYYLNSKMARLDVHITFNDGETANLEMQLSQTSDDLSNRAVNYASLLLSAQTRRGRPYKEMKRVYQIFFLNYELFPESIKLPRRYYYMEETEHDRLTDVTEIIFYEMPKLEKKVNDFLAGKADIKTLSRDEKWCIFMKYRHEERAAPLITKLIKEEEGIMRAEKSVRKVDRNYERFARKIAVLKNSMDRASDIDYARRQGEAAGIAKGETMGEEKKAIKIARKMLANGFSVEQTAHLSELDVEKVKKL